MNKKFITLLMILPLSSCSLFFKSDVVSKFPTSKSIKHLNTSIIDKTAYKTLSNLDSYFVDSSSEDLVISPSSYLLAISAISAVSDNFNVEAYGLSNDSNEIKELLEAWNFEYQLGSNLFKHDYFYIKSAAIHQQVGSHYEFDKNKRDDVKDKYISTLKSSSSSYKKDINDFFKKNLDLSISAPDLGLIDDAVLTYSALKMKDYVANGLGQSKNEFTSKGKTKTVDTYEFATISFTHDVPYFKGDNYQAFKVYINYSSLLIILPDSEGVINKINISSAYKDFMENKEYASSFGYIPYFHNKSTSIDITNSVKKNLTGEEVLYSKLLKDNVKNDLVVDKVMQTSDFEFNKYGVSGESITVIEGATATGPGEDVPKDLRVNRPFYAISLVDDFPVFVNKVTNL